LYIWDNHLKVRPGYKNWEPEYWIYNPNDLVGSTVTDSVQVGVSYGTNATGGALYDLSILKNIFDNISNHYGHPKFPDYFKRYSPSNNGVYIEYKHNF
jgi:hypothetical protein